MVQARELLKTSAAAGSVAAAFQLFDLHYSAGGEVVSETNALVYLKQAAEASLPKRNISTATPLARADWG